MLAMPRKKTPITFQLHNPDERAIHLVLPGVELWHCIAFIKAERPRAEIRKPGPYLELTTQNNYQQDFNTGRVVASISGEHTIVAIQPEPGYEDAWRQFAERLEKFAWAAHEARLNMAPNPDELVERYYRSRAAGTKMSLRKFAESTNVNYEALKKWKQSYDRRGGWGSKTGKIFPKTEHSEASGLG
jgi:hypothetical protein